MPPFEVACPEEGCQLCFKDEGSLQAHLDKNHPCPWTLPCQFCQEEFNNRHSLIYHLRSSHRESLDHPFKCKVTDCAWTFTSQKLLDQHSESNHGKPSGGQDLNPYNLRKSPRNIKKREPMDESYSESSDDIKSEDASSTSGSDSEKNSPKNRKKGKRKSTPKKGQKQTVHKTGNFPCLKCDKVISTANSLKNHIKWAHSDHKIKCPEPGCLKTFTNKSFKNHQRNVHQTQSKFSCQFCDSEFKAQDYLNRHIRVFHRDSKGYKFKCLEEGCGLSFFRQFFLDKHTESHKIGVQPTGDVNKRKCTKCDKILSRDSIKGHMLTHKEVRDRPWVCQKEGCGKSYMKRRELQVHMDFTHEIPEDGTEYVCKLCHKTFDKRNKFLRHRYRTCNDPSKKKPLKSKKTYKCTKCPKSFAYSESLSRHLKNHNNEEAGEKQELILPDDSMPQIKNSTKRRKIRKRAKGSDTESDTGTPDSEESNGKILPDHDYRYVLERTRSPPQSSVQIKLDPDETSNKPRSDINLEVIDLGIKMEENY